MPGLLILLGLLGLGFGTFALLRGHVDFARVRNRKMASVVMAGSLVLVVVGGALAPPAPTTTSAAAPQATMPLS